MGDVAEAYQQLAAAHGLELLESADPGPLTPLLLEAAGGGFAPAAQGALPGGVQGTLGHLAYKRNKTFRFNCVLASVPDAQRFCPRLFCVRKGRSTRDDVFYGFEARHSRLWTESVALAERYTVSISPFQDEGWMLQLFSPEFIDWLCTAPPDDFSFELAYGDLLASVEEDAPGAAGLTALCEATARVVARIAQECSE